MTDPKPSPWPVRLVVYAVLIVIALAAIKLIDDRAMFRMAQLENGPQVRP